MLKDDAGTLGHIPAVRLYVMGENQWRGFDELPDAAQPAAAGSWLPAEPSSDTPREPAVASEYDYDPLDPVPTVGGATMIHGSVRAGPAKQHDVEARADVLTFTSEARSRSR